MFSKLDATPAYWQIPLDESSQLLTTFNTPFGRYCFTKMPFGLNLRKKYLTTLKAWRPTLMIFSFGHLMNTSMIDDSRQPCRNCEEINLTLNEGKCKFKKEEIYCGHNFTNHGVRPDESKIKAIQEMPSPSSKKDVERLLGKAVNYLAKFVTNVANITAPIRELLKKEGEFHWSHEQGKSIRLKRSWPANQAQFLSFLILQNR